MTYPLTFSWYYKLLFVPSLKALKSPLATPMYIPLSREYKEEGISVVGASVVFFIVEFCNGEPVKEKIFLKLSIQ